MDSLNFRRIEPKKFIQYTVLLFAVDVVASGVIFGINRNKKFNNKFNRNESTCSFASKEIIKSIFAAFSEELFFRYFLIKYLFIEKLKYKPVVAISLSSLIYTSFRIARIKKPTIYSPISYIVQSWADGYIYYSSGNLFVNIVSHTLFDLLCSVIKIYWFEKHKKNINPPNLQSFYTSRLTWFN